MFQKNIFYPGLLALAMAACSTGQVDDGIIDYRITTNNEVVRSAAEVKGNRHLAVLQEKYLHDQGKDLYVEPGESISIVLQQVFLNDASSGEVAVIAKVYESTKEKGDPFATATQSGRIVHFSRGVKKDGQFLNFSSLPIYGPISYSGKPVVLEVFVMELDAIKSPQQQRLMNYLARAGATPQAPSSQVLRLLEGVGETLLENPEDSRIFKFRMVLFPKIEDDLLNAAKLRVGNYVFVKQKDEKDSIPWNDIRLNKVTGRLVSNGSKQDFVDKSYMILQLNKGYNSVEMDAAQLYGEILDSLNENTINDRREMTELLTRLERGLRTIRDRNEDRSKRSFNVQ